MISKKELLKEMGISYGQLYRWKREGLIPDSWFIKQSASTGQETYFKRDLIISRIEKILELKDRYQLDQLKSFLNPDLRKRTFSARELVLLDDLDPIVIKTFFLTRDSVTIYEVAIMSIVSKYIDILDLERIANCDFSSINNVETCFYILLLNKYYILVADSNIVIDNSIVIYQKIKLEPIITAIAGKL